MYPISQCIQSKEDAEELIEFGLSAAKEIEDCKGVYTPEEATKRVMERERDQIKVQKLKSRSLYNDFSSSEGHAENPIYWPEGSEKNMALS